MSPSEPASSTGICEACRLAPAAVIVPDDDPKQPYRLCRACEQRLQDYALRPLEWFNLSALHGPFRYLLHSDFYSCWDAHLGKAYVPRVPVETPERFPAPTLAQIAADQERLIDYAMTEAYLNTRPAQAVVTALVASAESLDGKTSLLASLQRRVAASASNPHIEAHAYTLCARCLGPFAANWIRERWDAADLYRGPFPPLSQAAAGCLPFDEAWARVTDHLTALMTIDTSSLADPSLSPWIHASALALVYFRSPRTLDWIEAHQEYAVPTFWGRTAALSRLSWPRAQSWLDAGPPLSHVALNAILACLRHDTPLTLWLQPHLEPPAPLEEMAAGLKTYASRDPTPDAQRDVADILAVMAEVPERERADEEH